MCRAFLHARLLFIFILPTIAFVSLDTAAGLAHGAELGSFYSALDETEFTLFVEGVSDTAYRVWHSQTPPKVIVDLDVLPGVSKETVIGDSAIERVRIGEGPLGTRIVIDLNYALPRPRVEKDSGRLLVVIPKVFHQIEEIFIAPGITYGSVRAGEVHGPLSIKYLRVDPTRAGVFVRPGLAGETFGRLHLREAASRAGAVAALNGGFFHWSGRPLGLVIDEGELLSEAIHHRTAFGIDGSGRPFIKRLSTLLWIETPHGRVNVDGVNRPRNPGEIVVYTKEFGPLPAGEGKWLFVQDGRAMERPMGAAPDRGFAVHFDPGSIEVERVRPGDPVAFHYAVTPPVPAGVRYAIGGGPQLVSDGKVAVTGVAERFQSDVLFGRAPRSAVGITSDGKILLVVVDGRQDARSVGATLEELAEWMIRLGAESAMNLDGGGSSSLVANGVVLNQPSDGVERPVASAILVFATGGT